MKMISCRFGVWKIVLWWLGLRITSLGPTIVVFGLCWTSPSSDSTEEISLVLYGYGFTSCWKMKIQTPQAACNALISRLELFSNFHTMVIDLTILPMSNTSLLNEEIVTTDAMSM